MKLLIIALAIVLSGCGSEWSGEGKTANWKSLFSIWVQNDTTDVRNFTGFGYDIEAKYFSHLPDGAVCEGTILFEGRLRTGTITFNNNTWVINTGPGDPNCNALNKVITYVLDDQALTLITDVETHWH